MVAGGAVVYATGVFLFSNTRSGMAYVLEEQVRLVPDWLSDQKFGLWHVLEFAGVLGSIFFLVGFLMGLILSSVLTSFVLFLGRPCS